VSYGFERRFTQHVVLVVGQGLCGSVGVGRGERGEGRGISKEEEN
jgi:hypothetical protein